jgi:hypothetical protein
MIAMVCIMFRFMFYARYIPHLKHPSKRGSNVWAVDINEANDRARAGMQIPQKTPALPPASSHLISDFSFSIALDERGLGRVIFSLFHNNDLFPGQTKTGQRF